MSNSGELREVELPEDVNGRLFLYNMPGRNGYSHTFEADSQLIVQQRIDYVFCLASLDEIEENSPEYAQAIHAGSLEWERKTFPIQDYGVPADKKLEDFIDLVQQLAADLRDGQRILIHCSAGHGRTGMVAICVLLALGVDQQTAYKLVNAAGSNPETTSQRELIDQIAEEFNNTNSDRN